MTNPRDLSTVDDLHRSEVKEAIRRTLAAGNSTFEDVLISLGAPDPRLLKELYEDVLAEPQSTTINSDQNELRANGTRARRLTSTLPLRLPASDPIRCQWWFTLDSVVFLANLAWELRGRGSVAFLGTPTVGDFYANWINEPVTILDGDQEVLDSLDVPSSTTKVNYDVAGTLSEELRGRYSVVLMDPPWYPSLCDLFIARGRELLGENGHLLCALPSRLTRPGVVEERTDLFGRLLQSRFEIISVESGSIHYLVPEFEVRAYEDVAGFDGRQWRRGDLLILRINTNTTFVVPDSKPARILSFSRNPRQLRFFLDPERIKPKMDVWVKPIPEFQRAVSARVTPLNGVSVWGTNRRAALLRDSEPCRYILESWAEGKTLSQTTTLLMGQGLVPDARVVTDLHTALQLWPDSPTPRRRSTSLLTEFRQKLLSELAAEPSPRIHQHEPDGFRLEFQRDRDRILWSQSLKNLANKTQLFPVETDDQLRGRLSHSIEVMQLAATIAYAFGLDRDLAEAGALVHDIGHCPFGHAGEHALNAILDEIDPKFGGFNHYEHGLDVVRWLEAPYRSPGAGEFPGLNLTKETTECILKHTYYRDNQPTGQSLLVQRSKHEDITDDSCHLEGQAVRVADKVSYLISDLEDGIRVGVFGYDELMTCRFFERPPIDLAPAAGESIWERFISQRRAILKVIMEDVLTATDHNLAQLESLAAVRRQREYVVNFSPTLEDELREIWRRLQKGILHAHRAVVGENMRAARIVRDLLVTYAIAPALIEPRFQRLHTGLQQTDYLNWYHKQVGGDVVGLSQRFLSRYSYENAISSNRRKQGDNWLIPINDLVMAKDYVASLTDIRAVTEHRTHCGNAV